MIAHEYTFLKWATKVHSTAILEKTKHLYFVRINPDKLFKMSCHSESPRLDHRDSLDRFCRRYLYINTWMTRASCPFLPGPRDGLSSTWKLGKNRYPPTALARLFFVTPFLSRFQEVAEWTLTYKREEPHAKSAPTHAIYSRPTSRFAACPFPCPSSLCVVSRFFLISLNSVQ